MKVEQVQQWFRNRLSFLLGKLEPRLINIPRLPLKPVSNLLNVLMVEEIYGREISKIDPILISKLGQASTPSLLSHEVFMSHVKKLKYDTAYFAMVLLKFYPFQYQTDFLQCEDKRITVCWGRQIGKTFCTAIKAIHKAYTRKGYRILIVAPSLRQSGRMFRILSNYIMGCSVLRRGVKRATRTEIELLNGSIIAALPCGPQGETIRGFTADMIIIDEAAFVPEEIIEGVIIPMLATTDGTLILISTPFSKDHYFYRSLMADKHSFKHLPSSICPLIKESFLKEQKGKIGELRYKMEYLAMFVDDATSFFKLALIQDAIAAWTELKDAKRIKMLSDDDIMKAKSKLHGEYALGCDFGKRADYSEIVLTQRVGESWPMVYRKRFELGTPIGNVVAWILEMDKHLDIVAGMLDQLNLGEAPTEDVTNEMTQIEGLILTNRSKHDALTYCHILMEKRKAPIPDDASFWSQLNEQQYFFSKSKPQPGEEITELGVMKFRHPSGRHDDGLWAWVLAIFSMHEKKPGRLARAW